MPGVANYLIHVVLGGMLVLVFLWVYTRVTPFHEFLLIRQGNAAAALSLSGALIGFSLTVASCILHTAHYLEFLAWAAGALVIQVLAYAITARLLNMAKDHIESGNVAYGGLIGAISLALGAINAACIF